MADGFAGQPEQLRAAAPRFTAEADRLASALATLRTRLDALGAPWGDDKQGRTLKYEPNRPTVEHALDMLSQGLASIDACLTATADNHAACERASSIPAG